MARMARVTGEALAVWERWLRAHRRILDQLDRELVAERGLTLEQYDVLHQLASAPGPLRMGELAASTLIAPSSCTRIVGGLVAEGWVVRSPDPGDRRVVRVGLTAAGAGAHRRAAAVHLRGIAELFADRLDAGSLEALGDILDRLGDPG